MYDDRNQADRILGENRKLVEELKRERTRGTPKLCRHVRELCP
jgi:hypothetical protein